MRELFKERFLKNILAGILLLGLCCGEAVACKCVTRSLDEFVTDADAIYVATLEEARTVRDAAGSKWPFVEGRFSVSRTLKGAARARNLVLRTGLGGGDCGIPMTISHRYIIFKTTNVDEIHDCDGSREIYEPEEVIAAKVKAAMKKRPSKPSGK
ncbi:hypothetical protein [Massilia sp. IC2-476]|uniref:hypothetical protein n=1 Tax=Massilia sp. IC2-476 TaxID=2887199 RepID=UPI001D0FD50B|nr:hypothetical protein [Massilia sp. IC2-476]MCC2974612.1 hypothetical protein [Massilia sp. IC2-476]